MGAESDKIVRLSACLGERSNGWWCYLVEYLDLDSHRFSVSLLTLPRRFREGLFFKYNEAKSELILKKYGSWKRVFKLYKVK